MPEQNPLEKILNELDPAILSAVGSPPFTGASWTPSGRPVNGDEVGSEILGVQLDLLKNPDRTKIRAAAIEALRQTFPSKTSETAGGKTMVAYSRQSAPLLTRTGVPFVGPLAVAAVSLNAFSRYAATALGEIKPFEPCAGDGCGYEPIIALIRKTIDELDRQFASGMPLVPEVDVLIETLVGVKSAADELVGESYFGDLQTRCGIDYQRTCTPEQEQIATTFMALVTLAVTFAGAWKSVRDVDDVDFFLVAVQDLRRSLYSIVMTVKSLRTIVPPAQWSMIEISTKPRVDAGQLWDWILRYCGWIAFDVLKQGRDGKRSVYRTMRRFEALLLPLIKDEVDDQDQDAAESRHKRKENPCLGLPSTFDRKKVQRLVRELYCQVKQVAEATIAKEKEKAQRQYGRAAGDRYERDAPRRHEHGGESTPAV